MRVVLMGGAPGIGKSAVARAVLARHRGSVGSAPLLQWIDVDAIWAHQPWRVDESMRTLVAENLAAMLGSAHRVGVEVVLVTWTFHAPELRDVVRQAAPSAAAFVTVQLVAAEAVWRARFAAAPERSDVDAFYAQRFAAAQSTTADHVVDTSNATVDQCAEVIAGLTLARWRTGDRHAMEPRSRHRGRARSCPTRDGCPVAASAATRQQASAPTRVTADDVMR